MRFRLEGADKLTGKDRVLFVEATDGRDATDGAAALGLFVSAVRPAKPGEQAEPAPPPTPSVPPLAYATPDGRKTPWYRTAIYTMQDTPPLAADRRSSETRRSVWTGIAMIIWIPLVLLGCLIVLAVLSSSRSGGIPTVPTTPTPAAVPTAVGSQMPNVASGNLDTTLNSPRRQPRFDITRRAYTDAAGRETSVVLQIRNVGDAPAHIKLITLNNRSFSWVAAHDPQQEAFVADFLRAPPVTVEPGTDLLLLLRSRSKAWLDEDLFRICINCEGGQVVLHVDNDDVSRWRATRTAATDPMIRS